jgi:hypothetical protein
MSTLIFPPSGVTLPPATATLPPAAAPPAGRRVLYHPLELLYRPLELLYRPLELRARAACKEETTTSLCFSHSPSLFKLLHILYILYFLVWDVLQTDFDCCGVSFPGDWSMTHWARTSASSNGDTATLPSSCCSNTLSINSDSCAISSEDSNSVGCIAALAASSRKNAGTLGGIACVLGVGQILLVVSACSLMKGLKKPGACHPFY